MQAYIHVELIPLCNWNDPFLEPGGEVGSMPVKLLPCSSSVPSTGWKYRALRAGDCNRNLLAQGRTWDYSGLWGCLVEQLKSIWSICELFRAL